MEKNSEHNAKPRKIIFPLNERENWNGKGSVKLWVLRKAGTTPTPGPCAGQDFLHLEIFDKTVAELSVSKKIKFPSTLSHCFLQQAWFTTFWKVCFEEVVWSFLLLNFYVVGSYWIFSSGF